MCNAISWLQKTCLEIPRGKRVLLTGGNPSMILSFLFLTILYGDLKFSQWNNTTSSLISVKTRRQALLSCRSRNQNQLVPLYQLCDHLSTTNEYQWAWLTGALSERDTGTDAQQSLWVTLWWEHFTDRNLWICLARSNAEPIHHFTEEFLLEHKIAVLAAAKSVTTVYSSPL